MPKMKSKQIANLLFLAALIAGSIMIVKKHNSQWQNDRGMAFGTIYNIKYQHGTNMKLAIENVLLSVDSALSMFNYESTVSKVNRDETAVLDSMFLTVFNKGMEVSRNTGGYYDITVAPLCNAWGFGFTEKSAMTQEKVDSILQFTGYAKVSICNGSVTKDDPRCMLDFSSIAKGFACDAVANLLKSEGIANYMIEIGGEVAASGRNDAGDVWLIGINKPDDDRSGMMNGLQAAVRIDNAAVATSGNYRNFYIEDGEKRSHTINPKTGYPVSHALLSATVIASDCMTADAYATAFMAMGTDLAKAYADTSKAIIAAYFITGNGNGSYSIDYTDGMEQFLAKE